MASRDQRNTSDDPIANVCMDESAGAPYETRDSMFASPTNSTGSGQKNTRTPTNLQNTSPGPYGSST